MELAIGCAYAGHGYSAREITGINGTQIYYRDFWLHDGKPISSYHNCQRNAFHHFAARLCTVEEVARFRRDEIPTEDQSRLELMGKISGLFHQYHLEKTELTKPTD